MTSKKTAITVLVSIFIVGFASGLVTDRIFFAKSRNIHRHHRGGMVSKFTRDLKLNEPQQEKLKELLKTIKTQYDEIRTKTRPEYNKVRKNFHNEFIKILNDNQKQKFLKMEKENKKKRQKSDNRNHEK
ncbi:MAG: hypothetical protein GXO75_21410 [Calditrichaeota bacterium]|nr:hypothetical protein [Calditrichota bacterium]